MLESGKKLNELRVSDLKAELEKRKLDTVGAKATLVERLEEALKKEESDPVRHSIGGKKGAQATPIKEPIVEEEVKIKEEPVDEYEYENVGDNEQANEEYDGDYDEEGDGDEVDQVGDVDDECVIIEDEEEAGEDAEENGDDAEGDFEGEEDENNVDGNNHDNEESLNLTIGEDEQKLLHEAADDKEKTTETKTPQKDKGAGKENKGDKNVIASKDDKKSSKEDDASKSKKKDDKGGDKKDVSEQKSASTKASQKDDKEKSTIAAAAGNTATNSTKSSTASKPASLSRNLWVSGLSSLTRASDLKTIFSKHGKVIGAKVVTNTRTPGTRCYGYVTMSSSADASRCIDHLHRTELHGRIISVERTKNEIGGSSTNAKDKDGAKNAIAARPDSKKKEDDKQQQNSSKDANSKVYDDKRKTDAKKDDKDKGRKDDKEKEKTSDKKDDTKEGNSHGGSIPGNKHRVDHNRHDRARDFDREREQRQRERERRQREIREERERQRLREKERQLRDEDRRRREIRERQRQEEARLAEERKKLALERERLEREKAELLKLERERQKLEREKIELERLELKRQQLKIMQAREEPIKRVNKRTSNDRYAEAPERKRTNAGNDSRFEAPPPPRFDASLIAPRSYEKKRDDFVAPAPKRMEYPKRDEYAGSGSKRSAIDDYTAVPSKRSTDDYTKRSNDYISSSSSKRVLDDYTSSAKTSRDDYKREVEIRHIPVSSGGVNNTFHPNRDVASSIHKASRYGESDRTTTSNYRRGGLDDIRSAVTVNKRYDNSGGYGGSSSGGSNVWAPSSTHLGHSNHTSNGMTSTWQKPTEDSTNWRPAPSAQDRYDRTYNERSSGYPSSGMFGSSGRPVQDRYVPAVSSRY